MVARNMVKDNEFYKRISKIGLQKRWEKVHSLVRLKDNLSIEKVGIHAYLCGDGWIAARQDKNKEKHYDIKLFLDNEDLAKMVVNLFKIEFNIEPKIKFNRGCFYVQIKNKPVCLNLLSLGKYNCSNWKILDNLNEEQKKEWIKCFFDCEAYVDVNSKIIQVKSINFKGLLSIEELLKSLGINSKVYGPYNPKNKDHSPYGMLIISKKEDLIKYKNFINFHHPKKKYKINQII